LLLTGLLAGPLAWLLDLEVSYALASQACPDDHLSWLRLVPAAALALVAAGLVSAGVCFRRLRTHADEEGGRPDDRAYFMAVSGLVMSALFALVILAGAIPRFLLGPCD
jgi:hypothetical protein